MHRLALLTLLAASPAFADEPQVPPDAPPTDPTPPSSPPDPPVQPVVQPPPSPPPPPPSEPTEDEQEALQSYAPWTFRPGGFIQPAYRIRQDAPGAPDDTNGFRLVRARLTATGSGQLGNLQIGSYFEAELQPQFSLFDAYLTVKRELPEKAYVSLDIGQTRVPISRQQLISDTRLSFVEKAQLSSIAPDRDLGVRFIAAIKHVKLWLGAFNGEGRDIGANADQSFFYAARLELTPIGFEAPLQESAFAGKFLSLGLSVGHNPISNASFAEVLTYFGYDISGAYKDVSGSFEYLQVTHDFEGDVNSFPLSGSNGQKLSSFQAKGFVAQLAYLVPSKLPPLNAGRFEVGARIEELTRNDQVPITKIGDPNQGFREYTLSLGYYMRQHTMKVQLSASHFTEIDTVIPSTGANATYDNDEVLVQVTYRVE